MTNSRHNVRLKSGELRRVTQVQADETGGTFVAGNYSKDQIVSLDGHEIRVAVAEPLGAFTNRFTFLWKSK